MADGARSGRGKRAAGTRVSKDRGKGRASRTRLAREEKLAELLAGLRGPRRAEAGEPVRFISHLSCSGGGLIARCVASMPNVVVLNDVDPLSLSPLERPNDEAGFTPSDLIALLRQGDPFVSRDLVIHVFRESIRALRDGLAREGRVLVLRIHAHRHFLVGEEVPERPSVWRMLSGHLPLKGMVSVRNPVDSYASLKMNGWHHHFTPPTFKEYCQRYRAFLDEHRAFPLVRHEDFTAHPEREMRKVCDWLDLEYSEKFLETFHIFDFSGGSGRGGKRIEVETRRPEARKIISKAACREVAKIRLPSGEPLYPEMTWEDGKFQPPHG